MTLLGLLRQPVTIQNRKKTGIDESGDDVFGPDGEPLELVGYLEQTEATEILVNRETYVSNWLLVLAAGVDVRADAEVTAGDDTLQVVGAPNRVWNPRLGREDHVECRLTEVTG